MSQMKLDLISIGEQLPPEFLSSFINRLSPKTYLRLRRTCSYMNDLAEAGVEKNEICVEAKNRDIELVFLYLAHDILQHIFEPGEFRACNCIKDDNKRTPYVIEDPTSIFGFHYREIYLEYYGSSMSAIELEELTDYTKLLLSAMRCDRLYLSAFPPENLAEFLPAFKPLDLKIHNLEGAYCRKRMSPGYELAEPELDHLKETKIQKIPNLSARHCKLSYRFNLLDLCQERQSLKLRLKESWEDCHPMICRFLQDVYNGVDIGPLERFTVETILPPTWRPNEPDWEGLSPAQLGNVPFIVLKPPSCYSEYADDGLAAIYYCETPTKKLILSARAQSGIRINYFRLDLYIIPLDDYSTFIRNLADRIYRPIQHGMFDWCEPGIYPIDNSHLYSLLENVPPSQYSPILAEYIANLNTHMDLTEYEEREKKKRKEQENIRRTNRNPGRRAVAVVSFMYDLCRRLNCFKM